MRSTTTRVRSPASRPPESVIALLEVEVTGVEIPLEQVAGIGLRVRLARAPLIEPIACRVIVQFFAASAFQNLPNDLFRGLLCQRFVFREAFSALDRKANFHRLLPVRLLRAFF